MSGGRLHRSPVPPLGCFEGGFNPRAILIFAECGSLGQEQDLVRDYRLLSEMISFVL